MAFRVEFTQSAADHVRALRKYDQRTLLDGIEEQLRHQPAVETRNRKKLTANDLSDWELRVDKFRVFYDVVEDAESSVVRIKAIGRKEHNTLYVGDEEVHL